MKKILLTDIIKFDDIDNVKIKFNKTEPETNKDPLDEWLKNHEEVDNNWLFWKTEKKNFKVNQFAICLIYMSDDKWLLTTIKKVNKDLDVNNGVCFEGEPLQEYEFFFGRVIIKYHKNAAQPCMFLEKAKKELEVVQILPYVYDGEEFQGYDNVCLTYSKLKNIIECGKSEWRTALEHQKAVYLITDKATGKLYVGSATSSNGMLLARWSSYVKTFHGNNKLLIDLVKKEGTEYVVKNFQYTILENYDLKTDDNYILKRELWWKKVLDSKNHGYNGN